MSIILPTRQRRLQDPQLAPTTGNRGECALCGQYGQLSDAHILPQSIGNSGAFSARGFLDSLAADPQYNALRRFPHGICFKTICISCNSALGGTEDEELKKLYTSVRRSLGLSAVTLPHAHQYTVRPNILFRAVIAHLASSNDRGPPTYFDKLVKSIFRGELSVQDSGLNLFYWRFGGESLSVARDVSVKLFSEPHPHIFQLIKFRPLAFLVTESPTFQGLARLPLAQRDSVALSIPIDLNRLDRSTHWPAHPGNDGMVLASSRSPGFVAFANWKPAGLKKVRLQR